MRRSTMARVMVLVVGLGLLSMGQSAKAAGLKCAGADGKTACTAAQVADINHGILVGKRMHKPLAMVKEVSLGPNGTLVCKQTDGSACTDDQLSEIISVTKAGGGSIQIMKTMDKASPLL